jgi:uncharacterized protein YggE
MHAWHVPVLVLAFSSAAVVAAANDAGPPPRTLAVTGEGEVKATPDLAVVSFAVETTAPAAGAAVAENARKSSQLADELKQQLGTSGKVSTTRYSLDPIYEQRERGSTPAPPRITGYVARNQVRIETHAIDTVGKLIDAAAKAGANRVDGLEFTLEQRDQAQSDALQRAGQDARRQAEAAAAAIGVTLGRVLTASANAAPAPVPRAYPRLAMAAEMSAPTPVEAGDVTVSATMQVTYEIQ